MGTEVGAESKCPVIHSLCNDSKQLRVDVELVLLHLWRRFTNISASSHLGSFYKVADSQAPSPFRGPEWENLDWSQDNLYLG